VPSSGSDGNGICNGNGDDTAVPLGRSWSQTSTATLLDEDTYANKEAELPTTTGGNSAATTSTGGVDESIVDLTQQEEARGDAHTLDAVGGTNGSTSSSLKRPFVLLSQESNPSNSNSSQQNTKTQRTSLLVNGNVDGKTSSNLSTCWLTLKLLPTAATTATAAARDTTGSVSGDVVSAISPAVKPVLGFLLINKTKSMI